MTKKFHAEWGRKIDQFATPNAELEQRAVDGGYVWFWRPLERPKKRGGWLGPFPTEGDAVGDANDWQGDIDAAVAHSGKED